MNRNSKRILRPASGGTAGFFKTDKCERGIGINCDDHKTQAGLSSSPASVPFEKGPCPLCSRSSSKFRCHSRDYNHNIPGRFRYVRCRHCGLVYENPRPLPGNIMALYPDCYGNPGCLTLRELNSRIDSDVVRKRAALVKAHCSGGTLLDIGCGSGFFLAYMQRLGWQVSGMEPATEHVRFARNRLGIESVFQVQWPAEAWADSPVHVVTLFHVIEHLLDPVQSVERIREILIPGGLLVVETPNVNSWPARLFGKYWVALDAPRHLNLFSKNTLKRCVRQAGFDPVEVYTFSPSVMEYTESIRYLISDLGIRSYSRKVGADEGNCSEIRAQPYLRGRAAKDWLHMGETRFFRGINILADRLSQGCNLLLVARKALGRNTD